GRLFARGRGIEDGQTWQPLANGTGAKRANFNTVFVNLPKFPIAMRGVPLLKQPRDDEPAGEAIVVVSIDSIALRVGGEKHIELANFLRESKLEEFAPPAERCVPDGRIYGLGERVSLPPLALAEKLGPALPILKHHRAKLRGDCLGERFEMRDINFVVNRGMKCPALLLGCNHSAGKLLELSEPVLYCHS